MICFEVFCHTYKVVVFLVLELKFCETKKLIFDFALVFCFW